jgi:hypothetical protein
MKLGHANSTIFARSSDFGGGIISNTSHGEVLATMPGKQSGEDGEAK